MRFIPEASSIHWHRTIWWISNARQPCSSGGRVSMENTVRHQRPSLTPGPNARLSFDACTGTNVGLVRTVNEDALLDFSEIGLWAVADGSAAPTPATTPAG